jgi:hypothetical protein
MSNRTPGLAALLGGFCTASRTLVTFRSEDPLQNLTGRHSSAQALSEVNFNGVTVVLTDGLADGSSYRQFVRTVSQRHEGSSERVPVYGAGHFHQPTSSEDLR